MLKGEVLVGVSFDSNEESRVVYKALSPELSSSPQDRAKARASLKGKNLKLVFSGSDSSSLRSSVNSYLKWIMMSSSIVSLKRRN